MIIEPLAIPSFTDFLQNWLEIILAVPGMAIVLLALLVYFGLKALTALFETVEEIMVK